MLVVDLIVVESFPLSLSFFGDFLVDVVSTGVFSALVFEEDGESSDLSAPLL